MNKIELAGQTTITGRNQISLPAQSLRSLGWERGDQLLVRVLDERILVLVRRPENWTEAFAGQLSHVFGPHDDTLNWLEGERRSWEPESAVGES